MLYTESMKLKKEMTKKGKKGNKKNTKKKVTGIHSEEFAGMQEEIYHQGEKGHKIVKKTIKKNKKKQVPTMNTEKFAETLPESHSETGAVERIVKKKTEKIKRNLGKKNKNKKMEHLSESILKTDDDKQLGILKSNSKKIKRKVIKKNKRKMEHLSESVPKTDEDEEIKRKISKKNEGEEIEHLTEIVSKTDDDDEQVILRPNSKKFKIVQRSEASQNISEFSLNEVGKERVRLDELIKVSKKLCSDESVKKQVDKPSKLKSLSIPLSKPELTKIKRTSAYEKVCDEVSKYDKIVRGNRAADQLIFPLRKQQIQKDDSLKVQKPADVTSVTHGELMKYRALVSYAQAKARRQNKIKSKRYHRMLKHEKLKKIAKGLEGEGKLEAAHALQDNIRIMERMTLKHKNTGKWAKIQKLRAKYNPEARSALKEDIVLGRQLREKLPENSMRENEAPEETQNDDNESESEDDMTVVQKPKKLKPNSTVHEEAYLEREYARPEEMDVESKSKPQDVLNLMGALDSEDEDGVHEEIDFGGALADENLVEEFRAEKKASDEANRPKGKDLFLPGWGRWGGTNIVDSKRKRRRFFQRATEEQNSRKHTIGSVIICEEKNEKLEKHMVKNIPFPFATSKQFESYIRHPVSHTWNPMSAVKTLVAPKVRTKAGHIIQPLDLEDYKIEEDRRKRKGAATTRPKKANRRKAPGAVTAF